MTDKKSKIPTIQELGKYVGKLFTDLKGSVKEIVEDYKKSHPDDKEVVSEETIETQHEKAASAKPAKRKTTTKKSTTPKADDHKNFKR